MSLPAEMEALVRQFIERAGSAGGEAWIRRCLALSEESNMEEAGLAGSISAEEERPQRRSAGQWIDEPVTRERQRCCMPSVRYSPAVGGAVSLEFSKEVEEDGGGSCTNKKRRTGSPSPGNSSWRGTVKQPAAQKTRGRASSPRPPIIHDVSQEQLQQEECLEEERQDGMLHKRAQGSVSGMMLKSMAQHSTGQPKVSGECQQFQALSVLVDSPSSLIKSFSPVVNPVSAATSTALPNPAPAAVSSTVFVPNFSPVVSPMVRTLQNSAHTYHTAQGERDRNGVPEACMKDVMPSEISPLGYHLSSSMKEKIWRGDVVDILSLLPCQKDFAFKSDRRGEEEQEEYRRRTVPRSFHNWLQAYCIYAGVAAEKRPELCGGLFQNLDHILEAYTNFGGLGWYFYDESFCQKLAIHPSLQWGMKDVGLWRNLILPQKQVAPRISAVTPAQAACRKGCCFAFNENQCRFNT